MAQCSKKRQLCLLTEDEWEPKKRSTLFMAHAKFTPVPSSPICAPLNVPLTPNTKQWSPSHGPNGQQGSPGLPGQLGPQSRQQLTWGKSPHNPPF